MAPATFDETFAGRLDALIACGWCWSDLQSLTFRQFFLFEKAVAARLKAQAQAIRSSAAAEPPALCQTPTRDSDHHRGQSPSVSHGGPEPLAQGFVQGIGVSRPVLRGRPCAQ